MKPNKLNLNLNSKYELNHNLCPILRLQVDAPPGFTTQSFALSLIFQLISWNFHVDPYTYNLSLSEKGVLVLVFPFCIQ